VNGRPAISLAKTTLGLGVGAVCLWLAFRQVPLREVGQILTSARLAPLALAVAAIVFASVFRAWRWQFLFPLEGGGALSFARLWPILVVGQMVNIFVPARAGDLARLYMVQRASRRAPAQTLGTIAVEKALDGVVFVVLLAAASLWVDLPGAVDEAALVLGVVLGVAVTAMALAVFAGEPALALMGRTPVVPARLRRHLLDSWLRPLVDGFAGRRRVAGILFALALSFLVWGTAALANYFCLAAVGLNQSAVVALVVLVVVQVGTAVPVSPGGLGVFEYLCVLALSLFAVSRPAAVGFGVLLHAVAYLTPVVLGAAFVVFHAVPSPFNHGDRFSWSWVRGAHAGGAGRGAPPAAQAPPPSGCSWRRGRAGLPGDRTRQVPPDGQTR